MFKVNSDPGLVHWRLKCNLKCTTKEAKGGDSDNYLCREVGSYFFWNKSSCWESKLHEHLSRPQKLQPSLYMFVRPHYNKTRLLQLGFSTSITEKTRTLLTWKMTSCFRQALKCGRSHVGQDVPNGYVPNGSEVWGAPRTLLHKVMFYFTTSRQHRSNMTTSI